MGDMEAQKKGIPSELVGFQDEMGDIQTSIADFESGQRLNIAVISEPFGGRTALVDLIDKMNPQKVTRLTLSSVIKDKFILPEETKRIILIDDCQFLYMRKIGGFDILEDFLMQVVSSNKLFITAWNLYSWNYLNEVINIDRYFPVQINISKFTTGEIKESILSMYKPDEIKFEEDLEFEKEKLTEVVKYPVTIKYFNKTINIPYLKIKYHLLKARLSKKEEKTAVEDIVFERINHAANGNPGVAKIVWERSLEYPVIKPSKIKEFSFKIELDYSESFILSIILSMGNIKKEELAEIAGTEYNINEIIFRLVKQGLIAVEEDYCSIKPEALRSIVDFLKKLRMV